MQLTIKDRVILLSILPEFDNREGLIKKIAIAKKIALTADEEAQVKTEQRGNGIVDVTFRTVESMTVTAEYTFTDDELAYMRAIIDRINESGMFSEFSYETYDKIIAATTVSSASAVDPEATATA